MKKIKRLASRIQRKFESIYFSAVWVLIIVPILSLAFILVADESPLYTSISRIGWVHNHRLFMLLWSITVLAPMVSLTSKVVSQSPLTEGRKRALYAVAVCNILVSFVAGVLVPAKSGAGEVSFFGVVHDLLTSVGWLSFGVVLTVFALSLFRFDRLEATVATSFMAFIWITGIFFIFYVVDESSYCGASAVTQVYIINMLDLFLLTVDLYQTAKISDPSSLS